MNRRKREPMSELKKNLIAAFIGEYDIQSAEDIQEALKDLLGGIIKDKKQNKIKAGIALKAKGRPSKDFKVSEDDKIAELKYIIARKDAKIKRLEMETELMRDFLSHTERK